MPSPMMMLWPGFLVSTSTLPPLVRVHTPRGSFPVCLPTSGYRNSSSPDRGRSGATQGPLLESRADGEEVTQTTAEPDPCLGPPGPDRCLDRPPARDSRRAAARFHRQERPQRGG